MSDFPGTHMEAECPECGEPIPVPLTTAWTLNERGNAVLGLIPDDSITWLHKFDKHPEENP